MIGSYKVNAEYMRRFAAFNRTFEVPNGAVIQGEYSANQTLLSGLITGHLGKNSKRKIMGKTFDIKKILSKVIAVLPAMLVGLAAVYYIALFLYIAISRIAFPFHLTGWRAVLSQANRVLMGQALYVEPSAAYVPLIYQPLYFYVTAAFIKLFGVGMFAPRLLSLLSSCGCMLIIFLITKN